MSSRGTTTEVVKIGSDSYEFKFDFAALREMDDLRGHNCFIDAASLGAGESKPGFVCEVIEVAIVKVNGKPVPLGEAEESAQKFITRAGYQIAHTIAQKLLAYVLVGDQKKTVLKSLDGVMKELDRYDGSPSLTFINRLHLWTWRIASFGVWAWWILSVYERFFSLPVD